MASSDNPGTRTSRHTRDDVAEAALRILDDHGLPDLTMRRLAAALDVQPSALYWHFPNKQTLLAELADRIADRARPRPDPDADWAVLARAEAFGLRDALLAYRDGAEVVSSTFALGLGASTPLTRLRAAFERGFDASTSARAAAALLHFVLGHVSHEQQRLQYDSLGVVAAPDPAAAGTGTDTAEAFAFGVDLLLEGLRHTTSARATLSARALSPISHPTSADPSHSPALSAE